MTQALATNPISLPAPSVALVDRAALLAAVEIALRVVDRKHTYPILTNLRIRGGDDRLFVTASDLDIAIDVLIAAADVAQDFDLTLPAHVLKDVLKGAPKAAGSVSLTVPSESIGKRPTGKYETDANGQNKLDADGAKIQIMEEFLQFDGDCPVDFTTGARQLASYKLKPLHPKTFPALRGPSVGPTYRRFTMDAADLFAGLDRVAFAISTEETRYYLNGIYLHVVMEGNQHFLRFVATDGHRMARQDYEAPVGTADMPGVILPAKTVALLVKLLKPAKDQVLPPVRIEVTDERVRFGIGDVTVTSKVVDGTFPDYQRVTPMRNDKPATFKIADLIEAINGTAVIASERGGKAVKIEIDCGSCCLSVTSVEHGTAAVTIPVDHDFEHGGFERFEIGFNARYLTDILAELKAAGETKATLTFNDSGSPTLVTGEREGWLGVLMPMRV